VRKGWLWVSVIGLVILFVVSFVVLYLLGGSDQSALERITSIAVIFLALSAILVVLLVGTILGVIVWFSLRIRDGAVPVFQQLTETITRVRGTSEFIGEEAVKPIISFTSRVAGVRALVKTVTAKPKKRG
jgi:quinol-cytochrome oxidoreductase complex cytochrome b subunit